MGCGLSGWDEKEDQQEEDTKHAKRYKTNIADRGKCIVYYMLDGKYYSEQTFYSSGEKKKCMGNYGFKSLNALVKHLKSITSAEIKETKKDIKELQKHLKALEGR